MRVREKIDTYMLVTGMILAILVIYLTQHGKDGYCLIPMVIYWVVGIFRETVKRRKNKSE
ncbi:MULTISPECIES: hypothetical protein [Bacillaceae]|uniref:hypothetical protein n=1 Tax=Bacillaceae TaxID=186817 RepID=UPI002FFF6EE1